MHRTCIGQVLSSSHELLGTRVGHVLFPEFNFLLLLEVIYAYLKKSPQPNKLREWCGHHHQLPLDVLESTGFRATWGFRALSCLTSQGLLYPSVSCAVNATWHHHFSLRNNCELLADAQLP